MRDELKNMHESRDAAYDVDKILMREAASELEAGLQDACTELDRDSAFSGNAASGLRQQVDKALFRKFASVINSVTGAAMSTGSLMDLVEDFDSDRMMEIGMEFDIEIQSAIEKYCEQLSVLVANTQSGAEG